MDARDAIARIKDHNRVHQQKEHGAFYITEALNMAVDALEKQVPKKPKRIDKNKTFDGNWTKVCPTCGKVLVERVTTKDSSIPHYYWYSLHCECGQRLDWGTSDGNT